MDLLKLPVEVLTLIIRSLVPVLMDLNPETMTCGKRTYAAPDGPFVENWAALKGLSLSCRHIHSIANPALYHTIILWSGEALSNLHRTLMLKADLRKYIRVFAVVAGMDEDFEGGCWDTFASFDWDQAAMTPFETRIFGFRLCKAIAEEDPETFHGLNWQYRGCCVMAPTVLAAIICLAPNIHTLYLTFPNTSSYESYDTGLDDFCEMLQWILNEKEPVSSETTLQTTEIDEVTQKAPQEWIALHSTMLKKLSIFGRFTVWDSGDRQPADNKLFELLAQFTESKLRLGGASQISDAQPQGQVESVSHLTGPADSDDSGDSRRSWELSTIQ